MSFQTDYRIYLYNQANQQNLHRQFSLSIRSDAAREQYIEMYNLFKEDEKLDLLDFLILYRFGKTEYQLFELPSGLDYIKSIEDLAKIGIEKTEAYWKDSKFLKFIDLHKITHQAPLNELAKQLDFMIKVIAYRWSSIDKHEVQCVLNIDFEKNYNGHYQEIWHRFSQEDESHINCGYQESETFALDLLVFMRYAINYMQEHPQAELHFTLENNVLFNYGLEIYNFFENEFK